MTKDSERNLAENTYDIHKNAPDIISAGFRGYQGADPDIANVIFLGLDANWPEDMVTNRPALWKEVQNYLANPVDYWKSTDKKPLGPSVRGPHLHHPFVTAAMKGYGRGRGYHKVFNKEYGYDDCYPDCVTFTELLGIPTYGRTNENKEATERFRNLLCGTDNMEHLQKLKKWIYNDAQKHFKLVLIPPGVRSDGIDNCIAQNKLPPYLNKSSFKIELSTGDELNFVIINDKTLWGFNTHFAAAGNAKMARITAEAKVISKLMMSFCAAGCKVSNISGRFPENRITENFIREIAS